MGELLKTLGIEPAIIAANIIGFILLWLLLSKFLFKPVMGILAARDLDIKSMYTNAEAERAKAEEFRADYEQRLAAVEAEARTRMQAAIKEAEDAKNGILADARIRSEEIMRRGQEDLDRERDKTLAELREYVVNTSLAAAGKLIGESMDDAKHRGLISDFIDRIGTTR